MASNTGGKAGCVSKQLTQLAVKASSSTVRDRLKAVFPMVVVKIKGCKEGDFRQEKFIVIVWKSRSHKT